MCTYQAERYLMEQLDSIIEQTHQNWHLYVSDDGSKDSTQSILNSYQAKWGPDRLSIISGPAKGFAKNFLSLSCNTIIKADFYAFSDQDDIWEKDKLERALNCLLSIPEGTPGLYCSRTRLVNSSNKEIGLSPLALKPPSFANALMQNIAGGNTMVFNNTAHSLLIEAGEDILVVFHDWWLYLIVTGSGGKVVYDPLPSLRYRQHDTNLIGMNGSWKGKIKRIRLLFHGRLRSWNDNNIEALRKIPHRLKPESQEILERFIKARKLRLISRLIHLWKTGIYRQSLIDNLGLIAAAIFNKI